MCKFCLANKRIAGDVVRFVCAIAQECLFLRSFWFTGTNYTHNKFSQNTAYTVGPRLIAELKINIHFVPWRHLTSTHFICSQLHQTKRPTRRYLTITPAWVFFSLFFPFSLSRCRFWWSFIRSLVGYYRPNINTAKKKYVDNLIK